MELNLEAFKWLNESAWRQEEDKLILSAPKGSDFFGNTCTAPYFYTEVTGDFVWRAQVSHGFAGTYDAASLMVMVDGENWAKTCFECTDFGTRAVVSVVTRGGVPDDANGSNLDGSRVWLQVTRVGDTYAFHYSVDGEAFYMTRLFLLPPAKTVKVGLSAQSPTGDGGEMYFENLSIAQKTVKNIRFGM